MKVTVLLIRSNFSEHKTLIKTIHSPNLIEFILLFRRAKLVQYLGHKKTWFHFPTMEAITNKYTLKELEQLELKGTLLRGNSKYTRTPTIIIPKL